jgi:hypothetical protein
MLVACREQFARTSIQSFTGINLVAAVPLLTSTGVLPEENPNVSAGPSAPP